MDLIKIGKFIASKRKAKNLTQLQLAELLRVSDRAVSKWECGRSMPDTSIMVELCNALGISVNDLLAGEDLEMEDYNKQAELNLIEISAQKEASDKRLLKAEIVFGITGTLLFFGLLAAGLYLIKEYRELLWLGISMIMVGVIEFLIMVFFALRIEQRAGYYQCKECGHRYTPAYAQVMFAVHMNRTRYMKCPRCGKKSWQKKVTRKD